MQMVELPGFTRRQSPEALRLDYQANCSVPQSIAECLTLYQVAGIRTIHRKLKEQSFVVLNDESRLGKIIQVIGLISAYLDNADASGKTCLIICNSETRILRWSYYFNIFTKLKTTTSINDFGSNNVDKSNILLQTFADDLYSKPVDYLIIDLKSACLEALPHDVLRSLPAQNVLCVTSNDITKDVHVLRIMLYIGKLLTVNSTEALLTVCDIENCTKLMRYCRTFSIKRRQQHFEKEIMTFDTALFENAFEEWSERKCVQELVLSSEEPFFFISPLMRPTDVRNSRSSRSVIDEAKKLTESSPTEIEETPQPKSRFERKRKPRKLMESVQVCLQNRPLSIDVLPYLDNAICTSGSLDIEIVSEVVNNSVIEISSGSNGINEIVNHNDCSPELFADSLVGSSSDDFLFMGSMECSALNRDEAAEFDLQNLLSSSDGERRKSDVFEITSNDQFHNQFKLNSMLDITRRASLIYPSNCFKQSSRVLLATDDSSQDTDCDEIPSSQVAVTDRKVPRYRRRNGKI